LPRNWKRLPNVSGILPEMEAVLSAWRFTDGRLKVSARGDDQEISSTIDTLNIQGEPGRTALDQKYLLGYLNGKQGIVVFSKYTDAGPVVFEYQKSPRVLIMPMAVHGATRRCLRKKQNRKQRPLMKRQTPSRTNPNSLWKRKLLNERPCRRTGNRVGQFMGNWSGVLGRKGSGTLFVSKYTKKRRIL